MPEVKMGRPRRPKSWKPVGTTLPPSAVAKLRKLGRGNVNHGILNLLEFYIHSRRSNGK